MRTPGFLNLLQSQLETLPVECIERINRAGGIEVRDLIDFTLLPKDYTVADAYEIDSQRILSGHSKEADALGKASLESGEVAVCFLMNEDSLKEVSGCGMTIARFCLQKISPAKVVWVIVPANLIETFRQEIEKQQEHNALLLPQFESICLTPDNQVHYESGRPVFHACGSGDAVSVLTETGHLKRFIDSGGKHVIFSDANDFGRVPDFSFVSSHISSGVPVSCLITDADLRDETPVICEHAGFEQAVERFRFLSPFDIEKFKYTATGTLIVRANLDFSTVKWSWHRRKIKRNKVLVIQYLRYLQDLTSTFVTQFIHYDRKVSYLTQDSTETK